MTPVGTKSNSVLVTTRSTDERTSNMKKGACTEAPTMDAGEDTEADTEADAIPGTEPDGGEADNLPNGAYQPDSQGCPGDSRNTESFKNISFITVTTVNTLLSICCIVLSIIMFYFRLKAHRTKAMGLVQILYLQNSLADFFVGLGVLLQSPILYLMIWQGREISYMTVPVYISYFLTAIGVMLR